MSDEYGPNFITLTDEDGQEITLEYVDALEHNGQTYMAFFPTVTEDMDEAAAEPVEEERVELPKEEALTTSLGSLLKNIHL